MDFKKIHSNVYVGAAIAAFAAFFMRQSNVIAAKNSESAMFPKLILYSMFLVAAWLIATGFFSREAVVWKTERRDLLRVFAMFGCMLLFALMFQHAGYTLSTMFLLGSGLVLFGHPNRRTVVLVTVLVPVCMFLVFTRLNVRLPRLF